MPSIETAIAAVFRSTDTEPDLLKNEPQATRVCQQGSGKHGIPHVIEEVIAVADEGSAEHQSGRQYKRQIDTAQDAEKYLRRKEVAIMHLRHDIRDGEEAQSSEYEGILRASECGLRSPDGDSDHEKKGEDDAASVPNAHSCECRSAMIQGLPTLMASVGKVSPCDEVSERNSNSGTVQHWRNEGGEPADRHEAEDATSGCASATPWRR